MSRSSVVEHRSPGQVFEGHVLEPDLALAGRQSLRAGPVRHLLGLVQHLEDALARRGRALRLADPHAERAERGDQQREVEVEGDEPAGRERAGGDHLRADEQHRGLRQQRDERDQRHVLRALPVRLQRLLEDELGAQPELLLLRRLLCERLDHVDSDDVLLDDRGHVGQLLLDLAERRVRHVAVAVGERDQHRRGREHDQRQLPLEEEQHAAHQQDGEHVLEEEDQPVAEEEPDSLEVDGGAGHELAGLVAVVEAERQPDQVRVDAAAHVHLDVERLAAGDEPAAEHQHRADQAEGEDGDDRQPEGVGVMMLERPVDHGAPGHVDERDRRGLRAKGEQAETARPARYGFRKPSRRKKIVRCRSGSTTFEI